MKIGLLLIIGILFVISFLSLKFSEAGVASSHPQQTYSSPPQELSKEFALPSPTAPAINDITIDEKYNGGEYSKESPRDLFDLAVGSTDLDCDGVPNKKDNCLYVYNPNQKDRNKDGTGDVCEGKAANKKDLRCDTDKDRVLDRNDNCPLVCNPDQKDKNQNGIGDVCDPTLLRDWVHFSVCKEKKHGKSSSMSK